jgi:pyrroline-5-carboxylate reductase
MKDLRLGFIGGGNMARALIGGLIHRGVPPAQIRVGEPVAAVAAALNRDFGVAAGADNSAAVAGAQLLLLAVKPQDMMRVVQSLRPALQAAQPVLLSIAAGIRVANIQSWAPGLAVVRAMPNRPALVGAGASGLYAPPGVAATARALAEQVMRASGITVWVPDEGALDVVTALSGSGPAYFFLLAECMVEAAMALGLDAHTARALAAETLHGAGRLAHEDHDLARQRAAVTSKGGTTAAALELLDTAAFRQQVAAALAAAARRGGELADQFGRQG